MKSIFDKYMKEPDKQKAHAVLSASGSERWLGCPGSVRLTEGIPTEDSEASIAGSHAHTLLQFILENENWEELLISREGKKFKKFISFSFEQLSAVQIAVEFVKKMRSKNDKLFIEQKLEFEGVGFGTSDIILYRPFGLLHVMDYKNGRGRVEAEHNTQMLYYAHAAADRLGWNFKDLWLTIIQPNADHPKGPVRTWKTDQKTLERAGERFRKGALMTKKKNAPLVANTKWCWFCPGKQICPEQRKVKREKLKERI